MAMRNKNASVNNRRNKRVKSNAEEAPVSNEKIQAENPQFPSKSKKKEFVDSYDLPNYHETRLALIAKDPRWIYAYWNIAPESLAALRENIGDEKNEAKIILRMYDITYVNFNGNNANHYFDLEIGPHTNSWYVNLWCDNASYCGEIGLRASDGRFYPLVRSNHIHVPRSSYSPRTEQIWMEVKDEKKEAPYVVGKTQDADNQPSSKPNRQNNPSTNRKKKIYLNEEDVKSYYTMLTPLLRDVVSHRLERLHGRSGEAGETASFILEGETEEEIRKLYTWLPSGNLVKKVIIGSSESLIIPGASEYIAKGASEFVHERRKDKFFFELGTELIVYGRTEPNAEVWLGDKKVQLREDGTFSLRFALPDGNIPLGFTAISHNKLHKREISTIVERRTTKDF